MAIFCDYAQVTVEAGRGGSGLIAFRREKFIPFGGPDGGNGGQGGDVYFQATDDVNTLSDFRTYKFFKATDGEPGGGNNRTGADGEDLILPIAVGTVIKQNGVVIADLSQPGQLVLIASGGRGGYGNAHFVSAVRQAPQFAEVGEDGERRELELELKLIADVGLVGYPSVGKSTLISVISNAKPKIADYPFTTLIPNLGVVRFDDFDFVVADIPGLIEGAHAGKGLGVEFLKHIQRTRIILHILDVQSADIVADYHAIRKELELFDPAILDKPEIVVLNKVDTIDESSVELLVQSLRDAKIVTKKKDIFPISAIAHQGLNPLLYKVGTMLATLPKVQFDDVPTIDDPNLIPVLRPHLEGSAKSFFIDRLSPDVIVIRGHRIEQIANMTNMENPEGLARLYDIFHKLGIMKLLRREKETQNAVVQIGKQKLVYKEIPLFKKQTN